MPTENLRCKRAHVSHGLFFIAAILFAAQVFSQQPAASPQASGPDIAWQPQIHFYAPPNWINDPNGPIFVNGQYHLFFQFNPSGDQWGHMSWGHAVSSDLAHWKQLPVAIPEADGVAIFSGSTVEDRDNTSGLCGDLGSKTPGCLVAIYTGASDEKQTQNIAVSRDAGATWTKFASNPVIDLGLKNFRDPKVFWHTPSQSWVMVVSLADQHKLRIYRSKNLRQWELASEFGPAGATSGVWECPDLIELPIMDDADKRVFDLGYKRFASRWLLSVNINPGGPNKGSADQYFIGQFDGFRFTEDHPGSGPHWADWGKDFYASTSFSNIPADANPERIWIAWMSDWQYASKLPSLPGRGEMTIARRIFFRQAPTHPAPTPTQETLTLVQKPILPIPADKRYGAMFGGPRFQPITQANAQLVAQKPVGNVYRLRFTLDPGEASEVGVRLRRSTANPNGPADEETVVGIDQATNRVFVDRTRSGKTDWSPDFPARVSAPLKHPQLGAIPFEIVVDNNSIEVFAEDGETVLTDLIYPSPSSQGLAFYSTATPPGSSPARIRDLELIPLAPPVAK
ncbi:MAG: glycoside hydrolase family 32 protein [Terracidiphilus sp.]|jgi:sucrose-6-phosphate hydrolase SacC (GH32 family)